MRVVADQFKILELEIVDVFHRRIQFHLRQRTRLARELQLRLFEMVLVKVQVAERVDEFAGFQTANLRHHQGEQRVAGDVERHAEKQIRAALIKLAAQFAVEHVELKQRVAGRQPHLVQFAGIPGGDDVPPAVGILLDLLDDVVDLVEGATVGRAPVAPLRAVDAAEAAVRVRPLVPDRHAMFVEIFDVRVAAQEPEQFVNDGFEVQLLRGEHGKTLAQIKPRLRAKHRIRAGAGAVGLEFAVFQDQAGANRDIEPSRGKFNHETHERHEKKFGHELHGLTRIARGRSNACPLPRGRNR